MRMRKKLLKTIISSLMTVAITAFPVYAQAGEKQEIDSGTVYENELGARLTATEYNKMLEYMSEEELGIFTQEDFDYMVEHIDEDGVQTDEKYVRTTYEDGEPIVDEYITEEEMLEDVNVVNKPLKSNGGSYKLEDNVTTDMKKIKMKIVSNGATVKKIELTCEWIKTPKVKSYDIIAIRVNQDAIFSADEYCYGKQYADNDVITYKGGSSNIKSSKTGLGISMNLVDNASKHKLELYANVAASNQSMIIFGTYQHATSDVTLSKSQKYNFSPKGMGGVIDFTSTTVYEKYDQTPGLAVWVTYE